MQYQRGFSHSGRRHIFPTRISGVHITGLVDRLSLSGPLHLARAYGWLNLFQPPWTDEALLQGGTIKLILYYSYRQ